MKKIIAGNWKMHGDPAMGRALALAAARCGSDAEIVLCPPATLAAQVAQWLAGSDVKIGGQDCHAKEEGAHTGDISARMLKAAGCSYVIVGHSERRRDHGEIDRDIREKAAQAMKTGLIPIICVGETSQERDGGLALEAVGRQVRESVPEEAAIAHFVLAYEPVWAIGSGKTPTGDDIGQMHAHILKAIGRPVPVLYGGSVKADNARDILAVAGVSGLLVGGASLKAEEFTAILRAA